MAGQVELVANVEPAVNSLLEINPFLLTEDQLVMLLQGNECDPQHRKKSFGVETRSSAEKIHDCFSAKD